MSSNEPRVLRCPHCGAPLDAAPYAVMVRCQYCGNSIKLAEPSAPPALPAPWPAQGNAAQRESSAARVVVGVFVLIVVVSALGAFFWARAMQVPSAPPAKPAVPALAPTPTPTSQDPAATSKVADTSASAAAASGEQRYPLRALLGVSVNVDVDGSRQHMHGLFPSVEPEARADGLRYVVPVRHPWFGEVELRWKNEKAGTLNVIGFHPPESGKIKNQKEIADCLTKGLGKPEVREVDHLAGDVSYFWGKAFPTAWANLYTTYLWLSFENPKGVAPVTFPQVVRTLDGCAPP